MNGLALVGLSLAGIVGLVACSDNENDVGLENAATGGLAGNGAGNPSSGDASLGGGPSPSGGSSGADEPVAGTSSSSAGTTSSGGAASGEGGVAIGGSASSAGGAAGAGDESGAGGLSMGGSITQTGGAASGGVGGMEAMGGVAGNSGSAGSTSAGDGGSGIAGNSGSAGSTSAGDGGSGGAAGAAAGGSGTCPPVPACNWCDGDALRDSNGCITGWFCPNGTNPCSVAQCPEHECAADETCYRDGLCWPTEPAEVQGVFQYVASPCTTDPCLPGLVAAIVEYDTSMTYVLVAGGGWARSDYDWLAQWDFDGTDGAAVTASGRVQYRAELDGGPYTELSLSDIANQEP